MPSILDFIVERFERLMRPLITSGLPAVAFILICGPTPSVRAQTLTAADNLRTCLSGRYPSLCNHSLLSPEQLKEVLAAERRENLLICLTGRYPSLCKHPVLTPEEQVSVREAEHAENLRLCLTGRYPSLCKRNLLTSEEVTRVATAERAENLRVCLTRRYPSLCKHSLLTAEQVQRVRQAEPAAVAAPNTAPRRRAPGRVSSGRGDCEDGHWIESVTDDGEIIKLEDGSVWEVDGGDTVDSALWLPMTDVIICSDKIINVDDNEKVGVTRLR